MRNEPRWPPIAMAVAILSVILAVVMLGCGPEQALSDTRYLHHRPGKAEEVLNPADAAMQAKGIAASRHVSPQEVRQLMEEHTEGRGQEPLGRQRINIRELNRALDERWPIK